MEARELRIGNYIKRNRVESEYSIVYSIGKDHVNFKIGESNKQVMTQGCYMPGISAIILTEEWLLKFGFIKTNENWLCLNNWLKIRISDGSVNLYSSQMENFDVYVNILHVHQLQNLYFALTGQELTLAN